MTKTARRRRAFCYLASFLTAIFIMFALYWWQGFAPFGARSLACFDADYQYLDFFSYLKDVLSGANTLGYSFSKALGGNTVADFSYYLASPFNLLVVFFDKANLASFFDVVVALKLGTAALTMRIFLNKRFEDAQRTSQSIILYLLSICYALGQYSIAQSSNIMWLDGVMLLPLMMVGVYRVANGKRSLLLPIVVGISILFNWYSGAINCLFSIVWVFVELVLRVCEGEKLKPRDVVRIGMTYACSMLLGVALSAALFLPTIAALKTSSRGSIDLMGLFAFYFNGGLLSAIDGLSLGAISTQYNVSLYCGSLALIGCIALFTV